MIPKAYITEWSKNAPWTNNNQVEQDLIIERALIEIFSDKELSQQLAFRGGTALHKLFLNPSARYSEDIDLVQIQSGEIGHVLTLLREKLNFLGNANYNSSEHNATLIYRFDSEYEPITRLKLKIEINTREHFNVFPFKELEHRLSSSYYSGECVIKTYSIEELLATKLRALFQRRKGRDLFDLWYANKNLTPDSNKIVKGFKEYIDNEGLTITGLAFQLNLEEKINDNEFKGDIAGLLRPEINYDISAAYNYILDDLIPKM